MDTKIIACATLKKELELAMKNTGVSYPVEYYRSGLHADLEEMHVVIQKMFDEVSADRVLLVMGFCGYGIAGTKLGDYEVIMPRVDDCHTLLIGSYDERMSVVSEKRPYFYTQGWYDGEYHLRNEFEDSLTQLGEKKATKFLRMQYANYEKLIILDTGADDTQELLDETQDLAELYEMEQEVMPASVSYLEDLLTGPWDDEKRFIIFEPNSTIAESDLVIK